MTLYSTLLNIVGTLIILLNGRPHVEGLEHIPQNKPFILAGTHRSFLDPILLAMVLKDREIAFMGKNTLFEKPLLKQILPKIHVFPVNRDKPSPTTIKTAVKVMNEDERILGIFPSGTRHSTEIKGGTAFIQKLSKRDILPVTIQPPLSIREFFGRKKAKLAFGKLITFDQDIKYTKDVLSNVDQKLINSFNQLDQQLSPGYQFIPK